MELAFGDMEIAGGGFQIAMAQQELNGLRSVPRSSRWVAKEWRST